jgi:hypothetical protein
MRKIIFAGLFVMSLSLLPGCSSQPFCRQPAVNSSAAGIVTVATGFRAPSHATAAPIVLACDARETWTRAHRGSGVWFSTFRLSRLSPTFLAKLSNFLPKPSKSTAAPAALVLYVATSCRNVSFGLLIFVADSKTDMLR